MLNYAFLLYFISGAGLLGRSIGDSRFLCQIGAIIIYKKVKPDKDIKTRTLFLRMTRRFFDLYKY
jgi:hypothetical protein